MKTFKMQPRKIPITHEADVLVAGGGYAGFGAAITAARNGMKTILVEKESALGGLATLGLVTGTFSYVEGIGYELMDKLKEKKAIRGRMIDPEITKCVLEQMLRDSSVKILFNTSIVDAITETGKMDTIKGAIIHNKSGLQAIAATRVVDASGDGDISAYAGAPYEVGSPDHEGYNQSASLVVRIGNVNFTKYKEALQKDNDLLLHAINRAFKDKVIPYKIDKRMNWMFVIPGRPEDRAEVNVCHPHSRRCKTVDGDDISRMLTEGREQGYFTLKILQKYIPGFENAWVIECGPMLGVRDGRRIMGEYKITGEDLVNARKFDDAVVRDRHGLDVHHPTQLGHIKHLKLPKKNENGTEEVRYLPGTYNEIPYRSLIPLKVENLLVAGRCVSSDFYGQSGTRLVLTCLNMGQAAGTAAALSIKENISPRKLSFDILKKGLIAQGYRLDLEPKVGRGNIKVDTKLKKADTYIGFTDNLLVKEKKSKNNWIDHEKADVRPVPLTDTGGDVGTDLE